MEILCPLWAYLTPLMVKQKNFLLISNQDFHVPTCFLCLSVAVHLSECRKLQRAIMCLLSALFLMLSKPSSCCLSCIPYSLSPPILWSPLDSFHCVSIFYWQGLCWTSVISHQAMSPVCPSPSVQQPCPPRIYCCPSVCWHPQFCWECTLSSHASALMRAIPSVSPHTGPWETPLCADCQLDFQALWQSSQFSACLVVYISSCHSPIAWQDSYGRLCQKPS